MRHVRVPKSVIAMIADLRSHLQENLEPPVYVSDRRLVKAIGMLQASTSTEYNASNRPHPP
jgi:MoxR-like ATPase